MENFELVLGKSKFLFIFFLIIYSMAIAILLCIPIFFWIKIMIIPLLCFQGWVTISRHAKRTGNNAIVRIWQNSKGEWGCQTRKGHFSKGKLKGMSYKNPWLFILCLQLRLRSINVIIPFDAVNATEYRSLCTRFNLLK
jgi:hypothetical protein